MFFIVITHCTNDRVKAKVDDVNYRIIADKCKADLVRAEAENGRAERFFERIKKADARGITIKERDDAEACAEKTRAGGAWLWSAF